ncbi:MAG TPA: DMT family transporter [Albitalea sp.]|nr:DMT family transporter [Albitalea sp.]
MTRLTPRTALLMTMPPLLWAGNAIVGRLAVGSVPPLTLNFLRWALAALILLPLGWRVLRAPQAVLQRWPYLLAVGLLGVGTYNSLQYLALVTSTPINVTLIAASMPVWMLAVGALFYRIHPSTRQYVGAALSLAGVVLVIARGDLTTLARVHLVPGDLYVLVSIIAWAFYSWLLAQPPAALRGDQRPAWGWAEFLLIQTLFGLLGAGAASAGEIVLTSAQVHWNGWVIAALIYVAIGPSIIAYRCWGLGVVRAGPALAAFFGNLTPLFAALLSAAVLGESPHAYHALAFALIVAGIVVPSVRR